MESKGRKIRFGVLCVVLAMVLVLVLVDSYCAFTPSGYEEVEKPMADARERIGKAISKPAAAKPADGAARQTTSPNVAKAGGNESAARQNWSRELVNFEIDGAAGWATQFFYQGYENRMITVPVYLLKELGVAALAEGSKLWPELTEKQRDGMMRYVIIAFVWKKQRRMVSLSDEKAGRIARELDRLEEFLLRKDRGMPSMGYATYISNAFSIKTRLVMERACLNGDPQKALELFDGYLDVVRFVFLANLYDGPADVYSYAPTTFLSRNLDDIPNFPGEWREHTRKALAEIAGFKVNEADALLFTANAWRERCIEILNSNSNRKGNIWHYFAGGRLESVTGKAFYPIVMRQVDEAAVALSKGDDAGYRAHMNAARPVLGVMNIQSLPYISNTQTVENKSRQLQEYAATVSAQIKPHDRVTSETIEIERFGNLTNIGTLHGVDLYQAVQNFHARHGHGPTTPEEIDAFIKENGREEWRQYVEWYGPGKVTLSSFKHNGEVMVTLQVEDREFDEMVRKVLLTKAAKNSSQAQR
ncbi:hypothetical protein LLG95_04340 [bacterium]|nr:hypothetical protein [bacterium]